MRVVFRHFTHARAVHVFFYLFLLVIIIFLFFFDVNYSPGHMTVAFPFVMSEHNMFNVLSHRFHVIM